MYVDLKKDNKKLEKQLEKTKKDSLLGGAATGRKSLNKKRADDAANRKKGSGIVSNAGPENNNSFERSGSAPGKGKRLMSPSEVLW